MKVDFFQEKCQQVISELIFGICDDKDNVPAYIDTDNNDAWIAIVKNDEGVQVTFTGLDKCIQFLRENGDEDKRCDAMLIYQKQNQYFIIFIELKDADKNINTDASEQLEATIKSFISNHNFEEYHKKKAFICNRRRPDFQTVANEMQQRFYQTYKVRLDINNTIKI